MCLRSRIMCELFHTQQKESPGVENVPAERKDTWEVNSTGRSLAGALLIISCTAFARRKIVGGSLRTLKISVFKYLCQILIEISMMHNDVTIISPQVLAVIHEKLSACYGAIRIRVNRIYKPCTLNNRRVSCMDEKI